MGNWRQKEREREKKEGNKLLIRPLSQLPTGGVKSSHHHSAPFSTLHLEQRQHYQDDHQGKAEERGNHHRLLRPIHYSRSPTQTDGLNRNGIIEQ